MKQVIPRYLAIALLLLGPHTIFAAGAKNGKDRPRDSSVDKPLTPPGQAAEKKSKTPVEKIDPKIKVTKEPCDDCEKTKARREAERKKRLKHRHAQEAGTKTTQDTAQKQPRKAITHQPGKGRVNTRSEVPAGEKAPPGASQPTRGTGAMTTGEGLSTRPREAGVDKTIVPIPTTGLEVVVPGQEKPKASTRQRKATSTSQQVRRGPKRPKTPSRRVPIEQILKDIEAQQRHFKLTFEAIKEYQRRPQKERWIDEQLEGELSAIRARISRIDAEMRRRHLNAAESIFYESEPGSGVPSNESYIRQADFLFGLAEYELAYQKYDTLRSPEKMRKLSEYDKAWVLFQHGACLKLLGRYEAALSVWEEMEAAYKRLNREEPEHIESKLRNQGARVWATDAWYRQAHKEIQNYPNERKLRESRLKTLKAMENIRKQASRFIPQTHQ